MIEVIHHGDTGDRIMCPKCNCDFRYFQVDMKWKDLISEFIGYVYCPECGERIIVKRENAR